MTKYYTFDQTNSGGRFDIDLSKGIDEFVIIEAEHAASANDKALDIGLYFDGCDHDVDCPCCGDRWCRVNESDGYAVPTVRGMPVMSTNDRSCAIHYADGKIMLINPQDKTTTGPQAQGEEK